MKREIASLHLKMHMLVEEIAQRIENEKYSSAEEAIKQMKLSLIQKERVRSLFQADKKIHTSCQTIKVAIETFCELNKSIVNELESGTKSDPNNEYRLVLGNALLVYELTDFTIKFIEKFKIEGISEIEAIHKEMQKTIASIREEQKALSRQASSPLIETFLREQVEKDIQHRNDSISILESEWIAYMATVKSLKEETGIVNTKLPSLKLIRDNAKAQINTLAAVAVLRIVRNNIRAIEGAVLQLEQLQLASLSAARVRRLLGV
ncbi:hypothetical protein [Desulfuromonas thiophila]|uniref:hypothetical protein n=1 Tax=Desulfuromonas thiophila TaxID=57664 RepID=UPI0024A7DFE7|nr:hypothetical protein [Desulfuromonas thiophila]